VILPAVRFLHTADWQLGMRRHFLGDDALPRFQQARIDAIRSLGRLAQRERCSFVVVAGDVFESNQIDRVTLRRSVEALREIGLPVYLLPGNHDPLDAGTIFQPEHFADAPNVQVLTGAVEVAPGVDLVGVPWPNKRPRRDLVAAALRELEPATNRVRILVGHGMVDWLSPDREDPARIAGNPLVEAIDEGRIHFAALGDRHSATEVHARVWYSGAPEPTDYDEEASGEALVVELDLTRCEVARHPVGTWKFEALEFALDTADDVTMFEETLRGYDGKERTILKLSLRGALSLGEKARLDAALESARETFAAVEIWSRHTDLVVRPDADDLAALDLSGFARTTLDELTERGDADALALLYRLAREA
jgi:DNA repair exonuclease SbcCD nuclease subunit